MFGRLKDGVGFVYSLKSYKNDQNDLFDLPSTKKAQKLSLVATNPIGKGKKVVSGSVSKRIADEIARRADSLDMSKSRYVTKIIELWFHEGCKPVSRQDEVMREAEKIPNTPIKKAS